MRPLESGLLVRSAAPDDVPALLELIHAAFEQYRGRLDPPSGAHEETEESIAQKLHAGGAVVAIDGDEFVGCAFFRSEPDQMYLGRLSVRPGHRGRGIARSLVEWVETHARTLTLPRVRVGVRLALTENRAYFERAGYVVTTLESHPGYEEATSATMEKFVTSRASDHEAERS